LTTLNRHHNQPTKQKAKTEVASILGRDDRHQPGFLPIATTLQPSEYSGVSKVFGACGISPLADIQAGMCLAV